MQKTIAKKTIILYVLKLLYKGSAFGKPITLQQMTNVLHSIGIECNKRTIGRNVQYLIDFGLPIIKRKGRNGGYFYLHEQDDFFNLEHVVKNNTGL